MNKPVKLTKAQQALLDEVNELGSVRCVNEYKPAQKLIELKLVSFVERKYGTITLKRISSGDE